MGNIFQSALFKKPQYSKFNLSHDWKGSYEIGQLIPAYWRFVHPGERFIGRVEQLTRFAPMLAPVMHQFDVTIDWHFCPMRLLDIGSEDFFNMQKNSNYDKSIPCVALGTILRTAVSEKVRGSLLDYFGYPILDNLNAKEIPFAVEHDLYKTPKACFTVQSLKVVSLRGYAKYLIFLREAPSLDFNDFYDGFKDFLVGENDFYSSLSYLKLTYEQFLVKYSDYLRELLVSFNSQQIENAQTLISLVPLYAYWRIVSDWYINPNYLDNGTFFKKYWKALSDVVAVNWTQESSFVIDKMIYTPYLRNYASDYFTTAFLDTQAGNAVSIPTNGTIIDLRQANAIQKLRERALYSGKRYIDNVLSFFGVKSSDVRLDRTEVLARDTYRVNISAVTQTNQSDVDKMLDTPLGTYVGEGYSAGGRGKFDYTAEEHGVIMCMVSLRPKASYMQGINPLLTKSVVTDFIIPDLAQIGEQSIPNSHLFCDFDINEGTIKHLGTFGYTRRYSEFMFAQSETHGDFRTSLNFWHATRMFDSVPTAGAAFNEIDVERDNINRIFAVTEGVDHIYQYLYFDIDCISPLPRHVHYDL